MAHLKKESRDGGKAREYVIAMTREGAKPTASCVAAGCRYRPGSRAIPKSKDASTIPAVSDLKSVASRDCSRTRKKNSSSSPTSTTTHRNAEGTPRSSFRTRSGVGGQGKWVPQVCKAMHHLRCRPSVPSGVHWIGLALGSSNSPPLQV